MSNKAKTREAEERARQAEEQARISREQAAVNAKENIKITPEAQRVLTASGQDYENIRKGDLSKVSAVSNFLSQQSKAEDAMRRLSPTGSTSLAFDVANPNLIAMNDQRLKRQQAQDTAAGVTQIAGQAEENAVNRIGSISGMDLSARSQLASFLFQNAGLAQGSAQNAWDRYKFEKSQKSFLSNLATAAVGGAASIASAAIGAPGGRI